MLALSPVRLSVFARITTLFLMPFIACWGQSFTSTGPITFSGAAGAASPYGSNVTVSGVSGTVSTVTVTINNFKGTQGANGTFIGDLAFLLVDNMGHEFVLWADSPCDAGTIGNSSGISFTFSDAGTTLPTNNYTFLNGGTYKPESDCGRTGGAGPITFPAGPTQPVAAAYATTVGSATFGNVFGGGNNSNPNGTWTLYTDRHGADTNNPGQFDSWTLTITPLTLTTPGISLSPSVASPSLTTQSLTFTATVSSSSNPVTTGSVTFTYDGGIAIGSAVSLNSSGQATSSSVSLPEGTHIVKAAYSGGGSFGPATTTITQVVNHPTTQVGNQFCNTGGITLNPTQNAASAPYPSNIVVGPPTGTNLSGSVAGVTLQLTNATAQVPDGVELLLVDPAGHEFIPLQQTGGTSNVNPVTMTLSDAGSTGVPNPWVAGTFSPTANTPLTTWIAPAPAATTANAAPPTGSASFFSSFGGDTPNGTWSLYAITGAFGFGATSSMTGWCLNFTLSSDPASTTTLSSSQNPALVSTNVTITATVQDATSHAAITTGTVTFKEGTTTLASGVALNGSGQATFTYNSSVQGSHILTASYSGVSGSHAPSTSAPLNQRVDKATTNPSPGVYCNTGAISLPTCSTAPFDASPYPSDITLPFIPGQVSSFTVSTNGITVFPQTLGLLLTSPNGSPQQNLVLMANQGGNTTEANNINLIFSDSGSAFPPNLTTSGTFKPGATTSPETVSFPSPAPPPGNLVFPATAGTATLASAFSGSFQGLWSLFANTEQSNAGESISGGWCMNLTITPPVATAVKAAVGGSFNQGQQGASYTITVTNNGPGSSGDSTGSNPVTVVDTLAAGLTPAATPGSGSGWTCNAAAQVITCTNSNIVAANTAYPVLTLFANVATNAASPISNHASVSGGGFSAVNSNTTSTTVHPSPLLAVSKSAVGTFTQGSTGEWDVTVQNTATGSSTSGTTTVVDTLPSGYTVSSFGTTSATWTCGSSTNTVTCTSTQTIAGGSSFPIIQIIAAIPAASAVSVTNNVSAFGGGDLTHTNLASAATGSNTVGVVQVPAAISINAGATQSTLISTAFSTQLAVTVRDAAGVVINNSPVTFTATTGANGQSGTFSNSTKTVTVNTASNGIANAGTFTANNKAGAYTVGVTDGAAPAATFNLTNTAGTAATVNVSSGAGQSTTVNTPFSGSLVALVNDSGGNPVSGALVTFTAPAQTGASATFAGGINTATTNSLGLATSAAVSANSHAGGYNVVASTPGATSANFRINQPDGRGKQHRCIQRQRQSAQITMQFTNPLVATVTDGGETRCKAHS